MRLSELIQDLRDARVIGDPEVEVRAVTDDSRRIGPGDVFVAVPGRSVDGHSFLPVARERGAAAVVVERAGDLGLPQVVVPSSSRALGWLAARALGRPADRMILLGVTGTNGKTTTTYLVEAILAAAGLRPGIIGTISYRYAGREVAAPFTTPPPQALHDTFRAMADAGCTHAVMETSSSALALDRLEGLSFRVALFSNLTQDHLDVHGTMAAYFAAKVRLFSDRLAQGGVAAAMIDDSHGYGEEVLSRAPASARRLRVSVRRDADIAVLSARSTTAGIAATLKTPRGPLQLESPALLGDYNLANLALAVAAAEALDIPHAAVAAGIAGLPGVPGRVERVANQRGLDVLVDYAHTPDALERVIAALRPLARGRLIVVFGCGGDRDPGKRPQMGKIAARDADLAIVTSDNPRSEDPRAIIASILDGVRQVGVPERPAAELGGVARAFAVEPDRRLAIAAAVAAAGPGDIVLIAGKGHEDYQIIGQTKTHFDDREEAQAAIASMAGG